MQSNGQFCAGNPTPPTEHATGPVWCTYPPPDRQIPPENIFMESCQQFEAQPVDVVHDSQVPPTPKVLLLKVYQPLRITVRFQTHQNLSRQV